MKRENYKILNVYGKGKTEGNLQQWAAMTTIHI